MSKKQIIQLVVLIFCLYLYSFFATTYSWEYYVFFELITLLIALSLYVIYSRKNHSLVFYLQIALYILIGYFLYSLSDAAIRMSQFALANAGLFNSTPLRVFWSFFQQNNYLVYFLLTSAVLLFNRPAKEKALKLGKLKISL